MTVRRVPARAEPLASDRGQAEAGADRGGVVGHAQHPPEGLRLVHDDLVPRGRRAAAGPRSRLAASTVDYLPNHVAASAFPATAAELSRYAAVILSDIGANTLLLHPDTFERSEPRPDRLVAIEEYVVDGGGLVMVGRLPDVRGHRRPRALGRHPGRERAARDDRRDRRPRRGPVRRRSRGPRARPPERCRAAVAAGRRCSATTASWRVPMRRSSSRSAPTRSSSSGSTAAGGAPRSRRTAVRTGARRRSWPGRATRRCGSSSSPGWPAPERSLARHVRGRDDHLAPGAGVAPRAPAPRAGRRQVGPGGRPAPLRGAGPGRLIGRPRDPRPAATVEDRRCGGRSPPTATSSRRGRCAARCTTSRPRTAAPTSRSWPPGGHGSDRAGRRPSARPQRSSNGSATRSRARSTASTLSREELTAAIVADRRLAGTRRRAAFGLEHAPEAARVAGRPVPRPEPGHAGHVPPSEGRERAMGRPARRRCGRAPRGRRLPRGVRSGDARRLQRLAVRGLVRAARAPRLVRVARRRRGGGRGRRRARPSAREGRRRGRIDVGVVGGPTPARLRPVRPRPGDGRWARHAFRPPQTRQQAERLDRAGRGRSRRRRRARGRSTETASRCPGSTSRDACRARRSVPRSTGSRRSSGATCRSRSRRSDAAVAPTTYSRAGQVGRRYPPSAPVTPELHAATRSNANPRSARRTGKGSKGPIRGLSGSELRQMSTLIVV